MVITYACNTPVNKRVDNAYVGTWKMTINNLPKVGDVKFTMQIQERDSLFSGFLIEEDGDTIIFNSIVLDSDGLNAKYKWDGHQVSFKANVNEQA